MLKNRVVWWEGMLLDPQCFQQQDRYIEAYVQDRCSGLQNFGWGFSELELDEAVLGLGKIAVRKARGVFPDGTPFNVSGQHSLPLAIEIPPGSRDVIVRLILPTDLPHAKAINFDDTNQNVRYKAEECQVVDVNLGYSGQTTLKVAVQQLRLSVQPTLDGFVHLPVACVTERGPDGNLKLDPEFIPPCMTTKAAPNLITYVTKIYAEIKQRQSALTQQFGDATIPDVDELVDFLQLQTVDRYDLLFAHLKALTAGAGIHPERLYAAVLMLAGDLTVFSGANRRHHAFPEYQHHDLSATFLPVVETIIHLLSLVKEPRATSIVLENDSTDPSEFRAIVANRIWYITHKFVIAVRSIRAGIDQKTLWETFTNEVGVGTREAVRAAFEQAGRTTGLAMQLIERPVGVALRSQGWSFFELEPTSALWKTLSENNNDEFGALWLKEGPENPLSKLQIQLWAVKK